MSNADISWQDDTFWNVVITEKDLPEFHPFYTGNGRVGVRVGALLLDWAGDARPLLAEEGHDFWGRLNRRLLVTLTKFVYDGGEQLILPAWNQVRLTVGGVEYTEESGRHHFKNTLDLRTGEVTCEDEWEYRAGRKVIVEVQLVVPRSRACSAWTEVSLSGLTEPATFQFGLNAGQVAAEFSSIKFRRNESTLLGQYTTRRQGRSVAQGIRWQTEGFEQSGYRNGPDSAWITLSTAGRNASIQVQHSVHACTDCSEPLLEVEADLNALDSVGRQHLAWESGNLWKNLWAGALHFQNPDRTWERLVLLNQFHLLASLDEDGRFPLGPLGLSRPGWFGSQMWDADFWVFRALLPLWPNLARSIVRFRAAMLPAARANAERQGLKGAFFPWLSTDEGIDMAPPCYGKEIHNNVWIGLAAWEAAGSPADRLFLSGVAWPILQGVADFFASRAQRDPDGVWHLRGVLPPDESVAEARWSPTGTCDDNVLTNYGVRTVVRRAIQAAHILGHPVSPEWSEIAERLLILPPAANGVIPEYAGYTGHLIKQADTILAFYPLELNPGKESLVRTVEYYHGKTDRGGPLMTIQIEALLSMLHGEREAGLEHLFSEYSRYVRGPHMMPFETPSNANSVMLTGIGGLLQALIFGWYGVTLDNLDALPRIGDSWRKEATLTTSVPATVAA